MDIASVIPQLLMKHQTVKNVTLTGSRSRGDATEWSDWDFFVDVTDLDAISIALPKLLEEVRPLSQIWDPLSHHAVYMLILKGPTKVDLIFDYPHEPEPARAINRETIEHINKHFWDWILWIASKEIRGMHDITKEELKKMHTYLLATMGCTAIPITVEDAINEYTLLSGKQKKLLQTEISPTLEKEVVKGLKIMGFKL